MNEVGFWLSSISLPQYFHAFQYHGFNSLEKCAQLTEPDLDLIGVGPVGHRKRILSRLPPVKKNKKEDQAPPIKPSRSSRVKDTDSKSKMDNSTPVPPPSPCSNASGGLYTNQPGVPTATNHGSTVDDDEDNIYMNYDNPVMKADHQVTKEALPPALPVKTRKNSANLNQTISPTSPLSPSSSPAAKPVAPVPIPPHVPVSSPAAANKRPVPKPRTSLEKKKKAQQAQSSTNTKQPVCKAPSFPLAGVSIEESTDEVKAQVVENKTTESDQEIYVVPKSHPVPISSNTPSGDFESPVYEDIPEARYQPPMAHDRNTPPLYDAVYETCGGNTGGPSLPPELPPLPARCSSRISSDYEAFDPEVPLSLDMPLPLSSSSEMAATNKDSVESEAFYDQAINVSARNSSASNRSNLLRSNAVDNVSTEHSDNLNQLVHLPTDETPDRTENIYGDDPTELIALGPAPLPPKPPDTSVTSPKVYNRTTKPQAPPNISERIVMGAETPDEEKDNQSNEFLEGRNRPPTTGGADDCPRINSENAAYQGVWNHETGSPLVSLDEEIRLRDDSDKAPISEANISRQTVYLPPPPFAPPPLPPGIVNAACVQADTPPPVVPPRPKLSETGITTPKTPMTSSGNLTGANRFSKIDPFGSFFQRSFSEDDPFAKPDPFVSIDGDSFPLDPAESDRKNRRSLSITNPRDTIAEFEEFSRLRVEQGQNSTSTPMGATHCGAQQDFSTSSDMCEGGSDDCSSFRLDSKQKRLSEDNIYGPMPVTRQGSDSSSDSVSNTYAKVTRKAPRPPPKTDNPFKDIYDHKRGTYNVPEAMNSSFDSATASVWESDDTLSDGGDFYEGEQPVSFPNSQLPIVPGIQHKVSERSGYLYKQASKRSSRINVWTKRFVSYGNREFKYFSSAKSQVSKRIIPALTMLNIQQEIKTGESHPFRFTIITIDRCYTFALDDSDDMTMWTSVLMQDILENEGLQGNFLEGGDMNCPDKEGFVRMDGIKGKRYLAIKKDKFCYYNTYNDYQVDSPIHRIEMKLGSVKHLQKGNKLQLNTPYGSYVFVFESSIELSEWKDAMEESIAEGLGDDELLDQVYENHSNKFCADCGGPDPHWASVNFCVTLCKQCAGIHRTLTIPQSKIRSLRMDFRVWTPQLLQLMKEVGNDNANNFWEWNAKEDDKIDSEDDMPSRKEYIINKYEKKKYCQFHPLINDQTALNEALCKNVSYPDVLETMQIVFSGADILYRSSAYSAENETPYKIAMRNQQTMQKEFLYQNGGEGVGNANVHGSSFRKPTSDMVPGHGVSMQGFLLKTGSNQKGDFLRRWVVLENGSLSYFENAKSTAARDTIEKKEILSITKMTDDRYEYAFEIGTTKHGGRVYLFAADSCEDRKKWMSAISKEILSPKPGFREKLKDLDKGGSIFQRSGATRDWKACWAHLLLKTLFIYDKDADTFEELDLRKANSIKQLQQTEKCPLAFDDGQPFVVDFPKRAVYMQGDSRRETECWYKTLYERIMNCKSILEDQQLTTDDIPVALDKCITFVSLHGMELEGIYRLNGQHSKVTRLLDLFSTDARNVHLDLTEFTVHDVATTMKRFLRSIEDPLLTSKSYNKWITTSTIKEPEGKLTWYKFLMTELPTVHYKTLQKLIIHLARVAHLETKNRMGILNLASIFGPVSMNPDKDNQTSSGYGTTNQEIAVLKDLLENYTSLFEVNDEKERKMEKAKQRLRDIQKDAERLAECPENLEMQLWISVETADETRDVCRKISSKTLAEEVLDGVCKAANLGEHIKWGLFEQICNGELERPVHYRENVQDITAKWGQLPEDFRTNCKLVIKVNQVYEKIELIFQPNNALFSELKYTEEKKKNYKKVYFEFGQYKLSYRKDTKASTSPAGSWNVEDLLVYIGVQKKRSPPTKFGFSFIRNGECATHPYFGHSVCCSSEEELYRWIGAILSAQHACGLEPGSQAANFHASAQHTPTRPAPPVPTNSGTFPPVRRVHSSKSSVSKLMQLFSKR